MADSIAPLDEYRRKRDFSRTSEPQGASGKSGEGPLLFAVQKHAARRLHFDLRLEWRGVLLSWAVTRGPSSSTAAKRLAVRTEDHPLDYAEFEGTIPKKEYGGGTVMLWDLGTWQPLTDVKKGLRAGKLKFDVFGHRMHGRWTLVRMPAKRGEKRENWLLIKEKDRQADSDENALIEEHDTSIKSGRTMDEIAEGAKPKVRPAKVRSTSFSLPAPKFRSPQLATSAAEAPEGDAWLHETKFDGYRCIAALGNDGTSLAARPLLERKERLRTLMSDVPDGGPLLYSEHIVGGGPAVFAAISKAGGEGIISKRVNAPYLQRRSESWLKVKAIRRQEFVVGGYSPSKRRGRPFASLLVGTYEGGVLRYRGRVGSGFSEDTLSSLASRLEDLRRKTSPFDTVPGPIARDAVWVSPRLSVEVSYTELTADGHLRHGVYVGLREDKPSQSVRLESTAGPEDDQQTVAGISVSSPRRIVFPDAGISKLQVAEYYAAVAERMLCETRHRPLSLVRCPDGVQGDCFYQRHAGEGFPRAVRRIEIEEKSGATEPYLYVTNAVGIVAAAQMGGIEFHIWGCHTGRIERPDRLVFDLDPSETLRFSTVKQAARELRELLLKLDLDSVPMLTGGKGIHLIVPLRRTVSWDTLKTFSHTVAALMAERAPDRYLAQMSKSKRKGRIFIDWLRNQRGSTAIAPYSLRARPGAPVAVPLTWDELGSKRKANAFTLRTALDRLERACPLEEMKKQTISSASVEALEELMADATRT